MPAVSKKQQKFFGIVRAIQKGEQAPTTPETAKAAADMKKGDVKKFASTKHKGLPEKKKIEEDRQVKKIIKQLRKSVKAHKKQADTLEKKVKTFKESNFSNITVGNKVGQTFQHVTGATITLDGALGGKMMVPSQVTIEIPDENFEGMVPITVDGPTESDFGLAGFTKPLDFKIQKRISDQSVSDMNSRLLASKTASGAPTARITSVSQKGFGGGQGNETNRRGYRVTDLPSVEMMGIVSGYLSVLVLALYVKRDSEDSLYVYPQFLWGVCVCMMYWVSRLWIRARRGELNEDPVAFTIKDPASWIVGVICIACAAFAAGGN